MDETCTEEQARLMKRTEELKAMTKALDLSNTPFDADEHAVLRHHLHQHELDLANFKRRCVGDTDTDGH